MATECKCLFSHWAQWSKTINKPWFKICVRAGPKPRQAQRPKEVVQFLNAHLEQSIMEGVCSQLSSLLVAVVSFAYSHPNPLLPPDHVGWGTGTTGSWSHGCIFMRAPSLFYGSWNQGDLVKHPCSSVFSLAFFNFFCFEAAEGANLPIFPISPASAVRCLPITCKAILLSASLKKFPHFCFPLSRLSASMKLSRMLPTWGELILFFPILTAPLIPPSLCHHCGPAADNPRLNKKTLHGD